MKTRAALGDVSEIGRPQGRLLAERSGAAFDAPRAENNVDEGVAGMSIIPHGGSAHLRDVSNHEGPGASSSFETRRRRPLSGRGL